MPLSLRVYAGCSRKSICHLCRARWLQRGGWMDQMSSRMDRRSSGLDCRGRVEFHLWMPGQGLYQPYLLPRQGKDLRNYEVAVNPQLQRHQYSYTVRLVHRSFEKGKCTSPSCLWMISKGCDRLLANMTLTLRVTNIYATV